MSILEKRPVFAKWSQRSAAVDGQVLWSVVQLRGGNLVRFVVAEPELWCLLSGSEELAKNLPSDRVLRLRVNWSLVVVFLVLFGQEG